MIQPPASTRHFRRLPRVATFLLAALLAGASAVAPAADTPSSSPGLRLERSLSGSEALRTLHDRLPALAAWHRMPLEHFTAILRDDVNAYLDRGGRLFYVEQPVPERAESAPVTAAVAPFALGDTFLLHSKPGSQRVIYLDFNGQVVSGTEWANGATINAPAYSFEGDAASFSNAELERIQRIWQRVSEDYAPFNVDVTTQEPAAADLERSNSSDVRYGTRALITRTDSRLCSGCGGVAYLGTFDEPNFWSDYQPAWVFYNALANGAEKAVAEAISHEVGHNLGLDHDGTLLGSEYYSGHGDGATGWAPIMGVGYDEALTQWSKGEYPNANRKENDLAIIPSHGAPTRSDDAGNTVAAAATLTASGGGTTRTVNQAGVIERSTDLDVFSFQAVAGTVQFSASGAAPGGASNLDIAITLLNSSGGILASANDAAGLGATLSASVAAGTYYLQVDGVGDASPAPGYSDYASLGQYRISGSYPATAAPPPQVSLDLASLVVNENVGSVAISVNLSAPGTQTVSVPFTLAGTAADGIDYATPAGSTITLAPGATAGSFAVQVLDDSTDETNERINITMGTPVNATAGAVQSSVLTLRDDDPGPVVSFSRSSQTLTEGGTRGVLDVRLSAVSGRSVDVALGYGGTATSGADYTSLPASLRFRPGVTTRRLLIVPLSDAASEGTETLLINVTGTTNATLGTPVSYQATILQP